MEIFHSMSNSDLQCSVTSQTQLNYLYLSHVVQDSEVSDVKL